MFRILHLSDIHIGKTYKEPENIACKIASDIDFNGLGKIRCIAVTGDIFDGQVEVTETLINAAVNFFDILIKEINYNQDEERINKDDVIFVPGNHDLIRVDNLEKRWSKYNNFLTQFYGEIPSFYNVEDYSLFKEYSEYKTVLVGFNSCQIEKRKLFDANYIRKFRDNVKESELMNYGIDKGKVIEILENEVANDYDDYGNIPLTQIRPMERKIRGLEEYNVVALFHHHFYLFPELAHEFGDSSLVRNYTEVIQQLKYMNVGVVLHGHKHFDLERPFIRDDYYNSSDNIIDVFAGGSVGTARKETHTFSILDLYDKKDDIKLIHNKFVYNGENLEPIVKKQIPPQPVSVRIVKLLEILKAQDADKYKAYINSTEKAFKSYDNSCKIITWVSEALTGFTDVYKYLDTDYNNILFLLYAVNFRTISYMKIVGKEESYYDSASQIWSSFYDANLVRTDFNVLKIEYHRLFEYKKLKDVTTYCDKLLNDCNSRKTQIYLAFSMLGVFFADLYLVLTKYADDFKESIKYKVNIKIEENKFHENVPAPRIVIKSDADRRSASIELLCNEATAHKMAVLFIKEFDLLINKFEDYFKLIGLKLYYLLPRIDKDSMKNTLDNYNFEAYIPTLLPLLTGDNIYPSKVVFARELIQNSIDAIAVREAKDKKEFSRKILIEIKNDENGKRYFKITDNGTGMDRYKIERYFTSIGRSFYSGDEYEDLNISYKPISNFGIGFLSSFMVCQEIDVKTKYYEDNAEGLKLHIPNYDGCFFIELDDKISKGTELKLYLDNSVDSKSIVDYIKKVMQDIKYDISINYLSEKNSETQINILAHSVRKVNLDEEFKFFIPFLENGEVKKIDYVGEIVNNKYIEDYEYGLLIRKKKNLESNSKQLILNAGIAVEQATLSTIFGKNIKRNNYSYNSYERENAYNDLVVNFPANWLQLDVARENITGLTKIIKDSDSRRYHSTLGKQIADCLYNQIIQFMKSLSTREIKVPAIYLQEVIQCAIDFCGRQSSSEELRSKLGALKYIVKIEFDENGLNFEIVQRGIIEERVSIFYQNSQAKEERIKWLQMFRGQLDLKHYKMYIDDEVNETRISSREIFRVLEETIHRNDIYINEKLKHKYDYILRDMRDHFRLGNNSKNLFELLTFFFLQTPDELFHNSQKEIPSIVFMLENMFLQYFKIGEKRKLEIRYDELKEMFGRDEIANNKL